MNRIGLERDMDVRKKVGGNEMEESDEEEKILDI